MLSPCFSLQPMSGVAAAGGGGTLLELRDVQRLSSQQEAYRRTPPLVCICSPTAERQQPAGDVLLELRDVHKSFGSKIILQGATMQVRRGDAIGIIGRARPVPRTAYLQDIYLHGYGKKRVACVFFKWAVASGDAFPLVCAFTFPTPSELRSVTLGHRLAAACMWTLARLFAVAARQCGCNCVPDGTASAAPAAHRARLGLWVFPSVEGFSSTVSAFGV